jgi:hypothetical protein
MTVAGSKLGLLLATGPDHRNLRHVCGLADAALRQGGSVFLYCIDEGVRCVGTPEIQALKERGVRLFACAYGAKHRDIAVDDAAVFSGLTVVSDVIAATDRFLSFS